MEENLMQTQTGGTGETIQLQTQETPSAEQFDVKINPQVDSEPPAPTQPIEPVKPVTVPTQQEAQQQAILPTGPVEEPTPAQPVDDLQQVDIGNVICTHHCPQRGLAHRIKSILEVNVNSDYPLP